MTTAISTSVSHHDRRHNRPAGTGFTLIELLAVIVILGIIVALVISVGVYLRNESSRKSTVATMEIIANALAAYQEDKGITPAEDKPNAFVTNPADAPAEMTAAQQRCKNLYGQLSACKSSADRLASLPQDANDTTNSQFLDGYGNTIDYRIAGGVGNKPVLISAGPDGKFGIIPVDLGAQKDNIRSDGRK